MNRFIKLSDRIINTTHIKEITIHPKQYYIQMNNSISNLYGILLAGSGWIDGNSHSSNIKICAESNPSDYKIIDEFVKQINCIQEKEDFYTKNIFYYLNNYDN